MVVTIADQGVVCSQELRSRAGSGGAEASRAQHSCLDASFMVKFQIAKVMDDF